MRTPTPKQLIILVCIAEIFSMLGTVTFPALLPEFIEKWQLTNTDAGWLNGIYFGGYLLAVPLLVTAQSLLLQSSSNRPIQLRFCVWR